MKEFFMSKINEQQKTLDLKKDQFAAAKKAVEVSENMSQLVCNFFSCIDFEIFDLEHQKELVKLLVSRFRELNIDAEEKLVN